MSSVSVSFVWAMSTRLGVLLYKPRAESRLGLKQNADVHRSVGGKWRNGVSVGRVERATLSSVGARFYDIKRGSR